MKDNIIQNVEIKNEELWQKAIENEIWLKPTVDILENEKEFKILVYLPGISKEQIKIKIEKNNLTVLALNDVEKKLTSNFVLRESELANYARTFTLSEEIINIENISAELSNGILELTLPKKEKAIPRTIEIK